MTQYYGKLRTMSILEKINYSITGSEGGRRWVFVHGMMGFLNNWQRITKLLGESESILCFDQRGHGRSFKPDQGYAAEDYAGDLKELTDALKWDRFILVGHSMGGRNSLVFASLYSEKVEKLVIEDIGPEAKLSSSEYYQKLLDAVPTPFKTREEARHFFKNDFPSRVTTAEPLEVLAAFLYANLEEKEGQWDWKFSKSGILETVRLGRQQDRWQEVASLKMPTLWIRGENSKELKPAVYEKILASNPMIQGVEVAGAGHWIHSEKPTEFSQALKNFVGGF